MFLTGITELFIVKNYALAAIFITPNALLIAETATKIHDFSYFATARITDILVGAEHWINWNLPYGSSFSF